MRSFIASIRGGSSLLLSITLRRLLAATFLLALPAALDAQTAHFIGLVSVIASGGGYPQGVAVDASGNIYIADTSNNQVLKETLSAGSYTQSTVDSGLSNPEGVAVDAAGNVYIADTNNNRVLKETLSSGSYTQSVVVNSGLYEPASVAVDGSGNVYITDTVNSRVLKETLSLGSYSGSTVGTGLSYPYGVAVDVSGNVYIADSSNNRVLLETLSSGTYTQTSIGAGLSDPQDVAVDGAGNVYIADTGNNRVVEETLLGGTYIQSVLDDNGFSSVSGVAVDASGNYYTADDNSNEVLKVSPTAVFPATNVGSLSQTLSLTFAFDTGGAIGASSVLTQGASGLDFTDAGTGTCVAGTYSAGQACTVDVTFTPTAAGTRYGAATPNDSSGAAIATGYVTGIGMGPQVTFSPGTTSAVGNGFSDPSGVAVDAAGNIFVADYGNSAVKEIVASVSGVVSSSSTVTTVGSGFSSLYGVAVDGAGNVFVGDRGNNLVKEIVAVHGAVSSSSTVISVGSGFSFPAGVAADHAGNVFVADTANGRVKEILAVHGAVSSSSTVISVGNGFTYPYGVAVDLAGNVFVADQGNSAVEEILAVNGAVSSSSTVITVGSGFNSPNGVTVDSAGNVFVADSANNAVKEIVAVNGAVSSSSTVMTVGGGFSQPAGVAVSGAGNVFVADGGHDAAKEVDLADPPSLAFASTAIGSTSSDSPRSALLTNNGNAALTFAVPSTGLNPSLTTGFTLSNTSTCPQLSTTSSVATLAAGASCDLSISFAPAAAGSVSGALVLTDNTLNASGATQSIPLSGTGLQLATTTTLTLAPHPPAAGGTVTLIATVAPAPTGSPLGSVTFLNNGVAYPGTVALNANGLAVYSISALAAGSDSWTAVYSGNAASAASTSAAIALTVASTVVTATSLAIAPSASVNDGSEVTLTATVLSSSLPVYPGTVLFCNAAAARCDGAALFGSAQLNSSGVAVFQFIPGTGTYSIKAVYVGVGSNGAGAGASAAQTLTVNPSVVYETGATLVATGLPGNYTLTGIVDGFGIVPPTGAVTFLNVTTSTTLGVEPLAPLPLGREFIQATGVPMTSAAWEATGDFNGDGIPDLVVVNNSYSGTVTVMLGAGDGTFLANPPSYTVGEIPQFVTVADLNHDGFPDVVVANTFSGTVEVLLGAGDGTFGAGVTFAVGSHPDFVAVGDLNGDGILDLAVTNSGDSTVGVLLGNGDGSFQAQATYATGTGAGVVIGDFNHDGIPDLAVTNPDLIDPTAQAQSTISLFLGVGDGTFPAARTLALPVGTIPSAPVAADLRRNGTLDLLFADTEAASAYVMLGNNDGTFAAIATYPAEAAPMSVAVGDINHDGILDMVVADTSADFSGKYFSILLGVGDGTFGPKTDYGIPNVQGPTVPVLADFNGDGLLDVSTADATSSDASVFLQLQTTTATLTGVSVPGPAANYAKVSYAGDASHLPSDSRQRPLLPLPSTMVLAGSPNPSLPGAVVILVATLTGASGTPTGVVSFYNGTTLLGTGTLNGSGVATYTLSSGLTTRTSLSATYPGDGVYAGSQAAILEYVGAATAIALSVSSTTITAGTPLTLTATVTPDPGSTPPAAGQVVFHYQQTFNGSVRSGALGPIALNSLGVALLKFVPGAGSYTVSATFEGTSADTPSTSAPQNVTVTAAAIFGSVTTLTPTTVEPNDYTLLAKVTAFGQIPATGLVSFLSDTTLIGSAPLDPTTLGHSLVQAAGSPASAPTGETPAFVAVGDLNGDGIPDLVTALNGDSNSIAVQLGIGNGTFAAPTLLALSNYPFSIAIADLNGDGKPDIIVSEGSGAYRLLGNGDGTFGPETFAGGTQGNPYFVAAADLNGDGIMDLAIACPEGPVVLIGNGDGTFQAQAVYTGGNGQRGLAIADFNHDGIPDLITANKSSGSLSLFLGVGDGTFQTPTTIYIPAPYPLLITAADLRHIGTEDVIVTDGTTADAYVLLGNNDGTFQNAVLYAIGATNSTGSRQVLAGDMTNDGILDLVVADYGQSGDGALMSVLPGIGDGTFGPRTDYPAGVGIDSIALADLNGDGLLDIATANQSGSNTIYLQQQSETASLANVSLDGAGNHNVLASYGGDASRTASQSAASVLTGLNQTTTSTTLSYAPNPAYAGQTVTFTARVVPIPTGLPLGTVSFYNGTALIGTGAVNAQGIATFVLTNVHAGSGTAHAVYSGNPSSTASTSASIPETVALTPTATTITSSSLTPAAGTSVTLTATVTPVPTGSPLGSVAFYSGSTLIGTVVLHASNIATLSTATLPAGPDVITAVYSGNTNSAPSTSSGLTVTVAGPATQLAVSGVPSTVAVGGSLGTALATIENAGGTVVTSSSAVVTMTITGPGGYSQAVTVTAVNGVATFNLSSLVLTTAGTYLVTTTSSGLASAHSTVIVSGVATATSATVTSSNLAPTYGQSVTLTATITPASTDTPPGTITFYSGTILLGAQSVSAQGVATLSIVLPLGPNAITAVYSGSARYAAATSPILSISNRAATAITFSASPTTQLATMPVALTALVNSATTGVQTGTVSFLNGSTVLATVTLVAGQPALYFETALSSGVYSVTASYSGDGNFLPSASTGTPISITVSDLDLALGGDKNKSVVPGAAVTYNFPLSPVVTPTFLYNVALTATGLPPGATYTFSPASIPAGSGTLPVAFTVQTAKTTAMLGSSRGQWLALVFGLLLPLAGAKRFRARIATSSPQRALPKMLSLLVLGALSLGLVAGLGGCGSGGFFGAPKGQTSYTITINATSGTLVRTSTVQLNLE